MSEEIAGFGFKVLFNKPEYTPHYAEEFVEKGRTKILMADPHMRRSAYVYDAGTGEVEWEYPVPGSFRSANPHIVRMLPADVPEIGATKGSLMLADRDNRWLIVERGTGRIEYEVKVPDAKWAHDLLLSKNGDGFIVTDYSAHFLRKIDFKGKVLWGHEDFGAMAKLSLVEGKTASGVHSNSLGGDYLAVRNEAPYGVFEFNDEGKVVETIPRGKGTLNNFLCAAPHSAFRKGIAELGGNLTVIGFEAGGGVVALDQWQRPRWGVMKGFTDIGGPQYVPSRYGLAETTHVFPTLDGGVGAVDWSGKMSSRVVKITKVPRSTTSFLLAWDYDPGDGTFLDPPLDVLEYDEVFVSLANHGPSAVEGKVFGAALNLAFEDSFGGPAWEAVEESASLSVAPGGSSSFEVKKRAWSFLRFYLKSAEKGRHGKVTLVVSYR